MSRLTGSDVKSMMEAYNAVYAPQELTEEQVWEEVENWVNSLLEEGYDLSEYTWEEMYEAYVQLHEVDMTGKEVGALNRAQNPLKPPTKGKVDFSGKEVGSLNRRQLSLPLADEYIKEAPVRPTLAGAGGDKQLYQNRLGAFIQGAQAVRGGSRVRPTLAGAGGDKQLYQNRLGAFIQGAQAAKVKKTEPTADSSTSTPRPSAAKPPSAPKPAPAGQTGDKTKDMATWAKANPKLAAAAAERARTRGTSSTTNPQMQDMKSRLPAAAPKDAPKPTPSPDARAIAAKASVANVTAPSSSTPTPAAPKPPTRQLSAADKRQGIKASYEYDAYDLVLEYLLAEGHADTVEEANYVMLEMDAEMVQDIVEQQTGAIRADVPRPGQRTVSMTATGKEPIGDKLVRQAGQAISGFLGGRGKVQSTTVQPRKPLVSTPKPGTSK